jgi:GNAT superfamily N-acetyltransferase
MKSQSIPMSWDELHRLPRPLGWKVEYWDGHAHLTPRPSSVLTTLAVGPRDVPADVSMRPAAPDDAPRLVPVFVAAFLDTIEYCDRGPAEVETSAREHVESYFAGTRGVPHPASRISLIRGPQGARERITGAALVLERPDAPPLLDLLFVLPGQQRRGLATALVSAAVNELARAGFTHLRSVYSLGNEASRAWHQRFGFVEEPDLMLAQRLQTHAWHRLHLRELAGDLSDAERAGLEAECARQDAWVEELEARARRDGFESVCPWLSRHASRPGPEPSSGPESG